MTPRLGAKHIHLSIFGWVGVWPKSFGDAAHIDSEHRRNGVPVDSFRLEQARGFDLVSVKACAVDGNFIQHDAGRLVFKNRHGALVASVVVGSVGGEDPAFRAPSVHDWAEGGAQVRGEIRGACRYLSLVCQRFAQAALWTHGLRTAWGAAARLVAASVWSRQKTGAALSRRPAFIQTRPRMAVVARASGCGVGLVPCAAAALRRFLQDEWAAVCIPLVQITGGPICAHVRGPRLPVGTCGAALQLPRFFPLGQMDLSEGIAA